MTKFSTYLKAERLKRAWSQEQMATKLEISLIWYKRLELGQDKPGVMVQSKLAKLTRRSTTFIYKLVNEEE